jgi:hypothetical protein
MVPEGEGEARVLSAFRNRFIPITGTQPAGKPAR